MGRPDNQGEPDNALGDTIRRRRRSLRLRQDELADLAEVSERFVCALENGKRTVQLDKVLAVLTTLGLHLEIHRGSANEVRPGKDLAPWNHPADAGRADGTG